MATAAWLLLPLSLLLVLSQVVHGYHYVGCYRDAGNRDLSVLASRGSMSVGKCNHVCTSRHFRFFGVQARKECWCGNSYGKYGAKPSRDCRDRCSGKSSEICGGRWRNSIYTTDITSGMHYIGCFVDNGVRDLSHLGGHGGMTINKCKNICKSRGYAFFGVQYADQCFCDNSYGKYGARPDSECNMHCNGDRSSLCGGPWRNNVYATGLKATVSISATGKPIRDSIAAKVRSMSAAIPAGVVCSSCLITSFRRQNVIHRSDSFPVSQLNARMSHYPASARNKLKALHFGANAKTTFEDSKIDIRPNHASKNTYFGIAHRSNNHIRLGMISTIITATLVHKYNVFNKRVCRKVFFWNRCKNHAIKQRRGYNGNEIRQIDAALQSETMRVFTENLGHIHV
ncbi:hypothetical protein BOX15_Mlig006903g1 [Macrostomum lignano]|uniref:WSC domain-containing protein n=2 Tax=Macrostomum lignano TaxID=282301 RepID=A0A1I8GB95_9PLAT|nr:hypothetical protein BOX15_Mlig006903g1 [Macrostomum lignano]